MVTHSPNRKDKPQRLNPDSPTRQTPIAPISELPPELLSYVFRLSLPMIDPMQERLHWHDSECRGYITRLYNLRCVSTLWRDVIDVTPSMWALVSFSWPQEVVKTALARSTTHPIIIHHYFRLKRGGPDPNELCREYLHIVNSHRSRWVVAVLVIPTQLLSNFFNAPIPRLHTLKLSLAGPPFLQENPEMLLLTPGLTETLGNVEHVFLNASACQCDEALGSFTRLKSLVLSNLDPRCTTIDQIIQTISNNPSLESLPLLGLDAIVDSTRMYDSTTPVAPPRLRILHIESSVTWLHEFMARLEVPPFIEEMVLIASATGSSWQFRETTVSLWTDAMWPLSSIVQRLHSKHNGPTISLENGGRCKWTTDGGPGGFRVSD